MGIPPRVAPALPLRRILALIPKFPVAMLLVAGLLACDAIDAPQAPRARFELQANDLPPEAELTLRAALDRWAELISTPVPIRVRATFVEGGPAGFSVPAMLRDFPGAPRSRTWYPSALADALAESDLRPGQPDMELFFRSDRNWKFDVGGNPGTGEADFLTVAMHEIAHGLGMLTWVQVRDGFGSYGGDLAPILSPFPLHVSFPDLDHLPSVYTELLADSSDRRLADTTWLPNPSLELGRFLSTSDLFFTGPAATAANGGRPPRVVSRSPSHLHSDDYFWTGDDYLMTMRSGTGVATPDPGPVLLGILQDIGWKLRRNS
jgi:hypothetical protein